MSAPFFRRYSDRRISQERLKDIRVASSIIEEYEQQGLSLTLRQLYYQHVARALIPNKQSSYDWLQSLINDGRMAGLISWTSIEDRTRNLMGLSHVSGVKEALKNAADEYRLDLWADQPMRPEVWVEKDALAGVIEGICGKLRVDFFSSRGYNSQSEQWRAGRRFAGYVTKGQRPVVLHLADHDPSGLDMTEDCRSRLEIFAGVPVMVQRLALNMTQVERYDPPPNPAKQTDSRFAAYAAKYGEHSWELDALSPTVIRDLIEDAVLRLRDHDKWDAALAVETTDREYLRLSSELGE